MAALMKPASETRSHVISGIQQHPFIDLSIDTVTLTSRNFLNADIVHPFSDILPLTDNLLAETIFATGKVVDEFLQQNALSWRASESFPF
jgi:hypothetical protein